MTNRWREWARRVGWALIGLGLLLLGGWVVVAAKLAPTAEEFGRWTSWANILALPVGAIGSALVVFEKASARVTRGREVGDPRFEAALADLALRLVRDWSAEAALREVTRPAPVTVCWSSTGRRAASRSIVFNDASSEWQQLPLRGQLGELNHAIVEMFQGLPHRQLMVLGVPGAGKSVFAILLTLGLIQNRTADEPLPVLLPINGWDPTESVEAFVTRRLAEDYATVLAAHDDPSRLARRLVERQKIMPILDGLDELPVQAHSEAVTALDEFASAGQPLVVTCRVREYEQAVSRGRVLSRAAVIELEPVSVEAVIGYLSQPTAEARWEPVFDHLRHHQNGHLATALSTPLMVALARTAYEDPRTRPADLVALTIPGQITGRLLNAFLTTVYTNHPRLGGQTGRGSYAAEPAIRWLTYLAGCLDQASTRDLQWWRITPASPAPPRRPQSRTGLLRKGWGWKASSSLALPTVAVACAAVGVGLIGWRAGAGWASGRVAVTAAVVMAVGVSGHLRPLWPRSYLPYVPLTYRPPGRQRGGHVLLRLGYGFGCGLLTGANTTDWAVSTAAGLISGLLAVTLPSWQPPLISRHTFPTVSLWLNHRGAAAAAGQSALVGVVVFAILTHWTRTPMLTAAAVYGSTAWLTAGGWTWLRFRLAHLCLFCSGQLPWRLWGFLDDAHRRGVLRRAGAIYQFRHVLLQDHLAYHATYARLRTRVDSGYNHDDIKNLVGLLVEHGKVDDLRALADGSAYSPAAYLAGLELVDLLARYVPSDVLRAQADGDDTYAAQALIDMLTQQGNVDEAITNLHARGMIADSPAAGRLIDLLLRQDRAEDAITLLKERADADDIRAIFAALRVSDVLNEHDRVEEAITYLQSRIDAGDQRIPRFLADLLLEHDRVEEAITTLRAESDAVTTELANACTSHDHPEEWINEINLLRWKADLTIRTDAEAFADVCVKQDRVEEAITILRPQADTGDTFAAHALGYLLAKRQVKRQHHDARGLAHLLKQGHPDKAIAIMRADTQDPRGKDPRAAQRLANLLTEHGYLEKAITLLRQQADIGDKNAVRELADMCAGQDRVDEAITILRPQSDAGDLEASAWLADLHAKHSRLERLRPRADAGGADAALYAANLLAELGEIEELRQRAGSSPKDGDAAATRALADLLVHQGHLEDAATILPPWAAAGYLFAVQRLAEVLVKQKHPDKAVTLLRFFADAGDRTSAWQLADLFVQLGAIDQLEARANAGDLVAHTRLIRHLVEQGLVQHLQARAEAGDRFAAEWLTHMSRGRPTDPPDPLLWMVDVLAQEG